MKKLNFALLLAFALSAVLVSCGGGGGTAPVTTDTSSTTTNTTTPTYFGTKSPTDPKAVNDIVFSDGSATPYTSGLTLTDAQKNAAVAMIFYKGTDCSNDDSVRTLGVGLKPHIARDLQWCRYNSDSDCANAYSTNITTIQCTIDVNAGAYTFTGDKDGSDNLSQIGTFLRNNCQSDDTGIQANYPAFYWAKNYGINNGTFATGWYLPSAVELKYIHIQVSSIDAVIAQCGFVDNFSNGVFWSSSQSIFSGTYQNISVYAWPLVSGCIAGESVKNNTLYICAIREF